MGSADEKGGFLSCSGDVHGVRHSMQTPKREQCVPVA